MRSAHTEIRVCGDLDLHKKKIHPHGLDAQGSARHTNTKERNVRLTWSMSIHRG
jgi:hypothetical protein